MSKHRYGNKPNRGYTLFELMILVVLLIAFFALSFEPMRRMAVTIPRTSKTFRGWSLTMKALEQIKRDVENCDSIESQQENAFTLKMPEQSIQYEFASSVIRRIDLKTGNARKWAVDDLDLMMEVWSQNKKGYAVAIRTRMIRTDPVTQEKGREEEAKLTQSFVYFAKGKSR